MENLMIAILIFIKNSSLRRSVKNIIYNKKRGCFLTSTVFCIFILIFISFSRNSSCSGYSLYSLSNLCGNKRNHQTQTGGDADGYAETGGLSKPSDNRWSYQETEETDARNDGDGNASLDGSEFSGDTVTDRNR